ncbi:flagellin [Erwinia piriflorinigrans]|uniref:Flagellin n=1 Tax=Erwinia piriflorinigrans CFBP 5888 TaxID=1161919 RepID=V5Z9G3_9GAMM|nr:flagellin [Erwinia piriflorinigrans]CCG87575.1 flagellin, filament structural protein FliC [Erwinia piriflorinigrans CFBP 5888]
MAQVINTNSLSLITQNNINKNQSALASSMERLSSGSRITSSKDDAAGQAIANRFTSNIKGLTQAARNANDGISLAQTTEGSLSEINNNLQRVRELTVQAKNGTNSDSDLSSIQDEIKSRLDEIDRVSGQTQFNGVKVLSGDKTTLSVQVGANDNETIDIKLQKVDSTALNLKDFTVASKDSTGTAVTPTADPLALLDKAISSVDTFRSSLGAVQNRLDSAVTNLNNTTTNLSSAQSRIQDADYATEVSNMSKAQIIQQAGNSVLAKANQVPQQVLSLLQG